MVRKLCTMLALAAVFAVSIAAFTGGQTASAAAPTASVTKAEKVLPSNEQVECAQAVTAVHVVNKALLSNKGGTVSVSPGFRLTEIVFIGDQAPIELPVRGKPKLLRYRGLGHNHYARAEI